MSDDIPNPTDEAPQLGGAYAHEPGTGHEPQLGGQHLTGLYRDYLLDSLTSPRTTHFRRAEIGRWLAQEGDTRPGVGLNEDGLPGIEWCGVQGGEVQVGDTVKGLIRTGNFFIAKYPVTWMQYRAFLDAPDGHANPGWWDGLRRRAEYAREVDLQDNQPVQEVSWFDAVAFCRWLTARSGIEVRLPHEAEWQQAATGGESGYNFPWGQSWERTHANTRESRLRRSTAVGMYPRGASPVGALDMAGNVLEWCANSSRDLDKTDPDDLPRTYRGGSWFLIYPSARVTWRSGNDPYMRYNSVGFRLVTDDPSRDSDKPLAQGVPLPHLPAQPTLPRTGIAG